MSQYDLFGDAAQVGGLRCLDAAVGGRAAERLPVEHEVVDAGSCGEQAGTPQETLPPETS